MNGWSDIRCDLSEEGAAVGLLALMTGISEENWAAGWMSGLEFDLWEAPAGKGYGMGGITERQSTLLKLLAEEAGGWWRWAPGGPTFVRLDEWRKTVAAVSDKHPQGYGDVDG